MNTIRKAQWQVNARDGIGQAVHNDQGTSRIKCTDVSTPLISNLFISLLLFWSVFLSLAITRKENVCGISAKRRLVSVLCSLIHLHYGYWCLSSRETHNSFIDICINHATGYTAMIFCLGASYYKNIISTVCLSNQYNSLFTTPLKAFSGVECCDCL